MFLYDRADNLQLDACRLFEILRVVRGIGKGTGGHVQE